MSKKLTAIEWLALYIKGITSLNCDEVIEQAKEMERQQIIDAYETGDKYKFETPGEQYYNKTFKTK